jgi:hypothetical protein
MRFGGAKKLNRKSGDERPFRAFCTQCRSAELRYKALEIDHYRPTYAAAAKAPRIDIPSPLIASLMCY